MKTRRRWAAAAVATGGREMARFLNLVSLVGTVTRCGDCGKRGFLAEVGVQSEPVHRKRRYFAEWNHPDDNGDMSIHEYWWS